MEKNIMAHGNLPRPAACLWNRPWQERIPHRWSELRRHTCSESSFSTRSLLKFLARAERVARPADTGAWSQGAPNPRAIREARLFTSAGTKRGHRRRAELDGYH